MNKPDFLYHGSHNTAIDVFEPRNEFPRFEGERKLVFATPHIPLAAMFLAPRDIQTEMGVFGDKYVIFINAREDTYKNVDHGGAIYTLPSAPFEVDPAIGLGKNEWTSSVAVQPLSKIVFETSLEAMERYDVVHYFVDDVTMTQIRNDPANALNFVHT